MADTVRLDRWLWAVRLYKTRSQAGTACRLNQVSVGGQFAKPARPISIGTGKGRFDLGRHRHAGVLELELLSHRFADREDRAGTIQGDDRSGAAGLHTRQLGEGT